MRSIWRKESQKDNFIYFVKLQNAKHVNNFTEPEDLLISLEDENLKEVRKCIIFLGTNNYYRHN